VLQRGFVDRWLLLVCCWRFDFIIFILTTFALRSRETPATTFSISFGLVAVRGLVFRRTRLLGCGVLRAYAFGQSSGKYVTLSSHNLVSAIDGVEKDREKTETELHVRRRRSGQQNPDTS
jgi:hypothetical protein